MLCPSQWVTCSAAISRPSARRRSGLVRPLLLSRPLHRLDDVLVAGAAADVPRDGPADVLLRRVRVLLEQGRRHQQHRRGAEAALQAVLLLEAVLHGWSWPSLARPSTVVTSRPSACTAKKVQDLIGVPSSSTVQAPQLVVSQPTWVPVRPSFSRRRCTSNRRGSTSAERV